MITFSHANQSPQGKTELAISYTVHNEGSIHEIMQNFRCFLLAVGFQPEAVNIYIETE